MTFQLNRCNVTVDHQLAALGYFSQYPPREITELRASEYCHVRTDTYRVHQFGGKRLNCKALQMGVAICAKGYDREGQISHAGLAILNRNPEIGESFVQELKEKIEGKIELYLIGEDSSRLLERVRQIAQSSGISIIEDLTKENFCSPLPPNRSSMIRQIFFDRNHEIHIHLQESFNAPTSERSGTYVPH